jgi:hypothetical protein
MQKIIIAIILLLLPFFLCLAQDDPPIAGQFSALREQAFSASAKTIGIALSSSSEPWGVVMEMGFPEALVTLVSLKDGTASLYFSNGGGVIGAGQHKSVSVAAKNLVMVSKGYLSRLSKTQVHPLPEIGKVRFYLLSESGIFASEQVDKKELADGAHPLSGLFYLGNEVITAIRKIDQLENSKSGQ